MADDDEFDRLCKSFEDKGGSEVDNTVGYDVDTSDVIDEIDSFLEEDGIENVTLNKEFQSKSRVVSTSKSNTVTESSKLVTSDSGAVASALSCSPPTAGLPSSPASSALPFFPATSTLPNSDVTSAIPPSPSDPLAQHWSEIAPSLANLPEDQARPVEQMGNNEGLDLSLLDKEEWEDEWELKEFTIYEILNELKEDLLDESDDEGESVPEEVDDESIKAEQTHCKVFDINKSKKEFESIQSRSRVTEERYYQQLEEVWKMYEGQLGVGLTPSRSMMVRPRIFKHNGRIVGYETLQEYIDNNHPLWGPHRVLFSQVLFNERPQQDLVKLVSKNWGDQNVNTAKNLTNFSRGVYVGGKGGGNEGKAVKYIESVSKLTEEKISIKATLVDMYANSSNVDGVKETEVARVKLFEAQLKSRLQEAENNEGIKEELGCDLCGSVCLCVVGTKRKGGREGGRMTKQEYLETVLSSASVEAWSTNRTAEVMFGVEEAYELQSCYNNQPFFSKEQVGELSGIEDVHDMILNMYDSPYKSDNVDKENTGTWMNRALLEDF